jgi:hypothetical protein
MAHRIRIYNIEATYSAGLWTCSDDPLQALLQNFVDPSELHSGDPLHELKTASCAAERLGGLLLGGPYPELEAWKSVELERENARKAAEAAKEVKMPKAPKMPKGLARLVENITGRWARG